MGREVTATNLLYPINFIAFTVRNLYFERVSFARQQDVLCGRNCGKDQQDAFNMRLGLDLKGYR